MPSEHQHGARTTYEPEVELEAKFGEDPARFLCSNAGFAKARIKAIDDPELLTAYATVEGERHGRREVLAFINQRIDAVTSED